MGINNLLARDITKMDRVRLGFLVNNLVYWNFSRAEISKTRCLKERSQHSSSVICRSAFWSIIPTGEGLTWRAIERKRNVRRHFLTNCMLWVLLRDVTSFLKLVSLCLVELNVGYSLTFGSRNESIAHLHNVLSNAFQ